MQPVAQASAAPLTQPAAGVSEPQNGCLQAKKIPLAQVQAAMQHRHDPFLLSVLCHTLPDVIPPHLAQLSRNFDEVFDMAMRQFCVSNQIDRVQWLQPTKI